MHRILNPFLHFLKKHISFTQSSWTLFNSALYWGVSEIIKFSIWFVILFIGLFIFIYLMYIVPTTVPNYIVVYIIMIKFWICIVSALLIMLTLIYLIEHYDPKPLFYSSMLVFIVIFKLNSDNPQLILCTLSLLYLTVAFYNYSANDKPKITILQKLILFLYIVKNNFFLFCIKWCFVFIFYGILSWCFDLIFTNLIDWVFDWVLLRLAFSFLLKLMFIKIDCTYSKKKFILKDAFILAISSTDIQEIPLYIIFSSTSTLIRLYVLSNIVSNYEKLVLSFKPDYNIFNEKGFWYVISSISLIKMKNSIKLSVINVNLKSLCNIRLLSTTPGAVLLPSLTPEPTETLPEPATIKELKNIVSEARKECINIRAPVRSNSNPSFKADNYIKAKHKLLETELNVYKELERQMRIDSKYKQGLNFYKGQELKDLIHYKWGLDKSYGLTKKSLSDAEFSERTLLFESSNNFSFKRVEKEIESTKEKIGSVINNKVNFTNTRKLQNLFSTLNVQYPLIRDRYNVISNNLVNPNANRTDVTKDYLNLLHDCLTFDNENKAVMLAILKTKNFNGKASINKFMKFNNYTSMATLLEKLDSQKTKEMFITYINDKKKFNELSSQTGEKPNDLKEARNENKICNRLVQNYINEKKAKNK